MRPPPRQPPAERRALRLGLCVHERRVDRAVEAEQVLRANPERLVVGLAARAARRRLTPCVVRVHLVLCAPCLHARKGTELAQSHSCLVFAACAAMHGMAAADAPLQL